MRPVFTSLILFGCSSIISVQSSKIENGNHEKFQVKISSSIQQFKKLNEVMQKETGNNNGRDLQFFSCPQECTSPELCDCLSGDMGKCQSPDTLMSVMESCSDSSLSSCVPSQFGTVCLSFCSDSAGTSPFSMPGLGIDLETVCGACDFLGCCDSGAASVEECMALIPDLGFITMAEEEAVSLEVDEDVEGVESTDDFGQLNYDGTGPEYQYGDDFLGFWDGGDMSFLGETSDILPMLSYLIGSLNFCPDDTCPVSGFCECMGGDVTTCDISLLNEVCANSAFFSCGPEGFAEMCSTECSSEGTGDAVLCSFCNLATCCDGQTTIEECAMTSFIPEKVISVVEAHQFCPEGSTCPVEGFCSCFSGGFMECDMELLREACTRDAFFECGPDGFEAMCETKCSGGDGGGGILDLVHCAACDVARCCRDGNGIFEDCAMLPVTTMHSDSKQISDDASSFITAHQFCPEGTTCTVDGFCNCFAQGKLMECDMEMLQEACTQNAFFTCGPDGFQDMCDTKCTESDTGEGLLDWAHCAICEFATCCQGGNTVENCTMSSLPIAEISEEVNYLIEAHEFCPVGSTCPVDGFCDCFSLSGNPMECDMSLLQNACSQNAFFECGPEGFKEMCDTKCNGSGAGGNVLDWVHCAACGIAKCCEGGDTIESCAMSSMPILEISNHINSFIEAHEFCPDASICPVDGFCQCASGNLMDCNIGLIENVCTSDSFFACGPEGFEEMCNSVCTGDTNGDNLIDQAHCTLCGIAQCCGETNDLEQCIAMAGRAIAPSKEIASTVEADSPPVEEIAPDEAPTEVEEVFPDSDSTPVVGAESSVRAADAESMAFAHGVASVVIVASLAFSTIILMQ